VGVTHAQGDHAAELGVILRANVGQIVVGQRVQVACAARSSNVQGDGPLLLYGVVVLQPVTGYKIDCIKLVSCYVMVRRAVSHSALQQRSLPRRPAASRHTGACVACALLLGVGLLCGWLVICAPSKSLSLSVICSIRGAVLRNASGSLPLMRFFPKRSQPCSLAA
jgi:hypothetical protein